MALRALLALAVVVSLLVAPRARAAPMFTKLEDVRKHAVIVVAGEVTHGRNGITIDVDRVLRGNVKQGPLAVNPSPDGHVFVPNGVGRVVAFIDCQRRFRWMATKVAGKSLEKGVLRLEGFFDFNAHIVEPGLMSFDQLTRYLRSGKLKQVFDVTMAFPDGKGGLRASKRSLRVDHDPLSRKAKVTGLKLPCLAPYDELHGLSWGDFTLTFHNTCAGSSVVTATHGNVSHARSRSLSLEGEYTGLDERTGAIRVQVAPHRPFLYEADFERFAKDGTIIDIVPRLGVVLQDRSVWTWEVGQRLVDDQGKGFEPGGMSMRSETQNGATVSTIEYSFGGATLTVSPSAKMGSPGGHPFSVMQLFDSGGVQSCSFRSGGGPAQPCALKKLAPLTFRK